MSANNHRKLTYAEWQTEGKRRFGDDPFAWKFICPVCGYVACSRDWTNAGATDGEVAFSCLGRHLAGSKQAFEEKGKGPCTYAGGGLFKLNPVRVALPDGKEIDVFEFAPENKP